MSHDSAWYRRAFAHDYLRIYRHRDAAEAREHVQALLAMLALPVGTPCLDLCCGGGRHLRYLRAAGLAAQGGDLSEVLLVSALADGDLAGRLVQLDMRHLPWRNGSFGAAFSFFSSFGYFHDDAENARVIRELARVLRPGGRLLLDFLNPAQVRAELVPEDEREFADFRLRQRRWLDPANRSVEKELVVYDAAGERRYRESVKLYEPDDFRTFCAAAGLTVERFLGSPAGDAWSPRSPRQILLARRPGSA